MSEQNQLQQLLQIAKENVSHMKNEDGHPSLIYGEDIFTNLDQEAETFELYNEEEEDDMIGQLYSVYEEFDGEPGNKNKINSWLAYCLRLTNKSPDEDKEFFPSKRIYARKDFPDIDIDIDDAGRDRLYQYMIDKYGRRNVGNIGTYGGLKLKKAIKEVVRAVDAANAFHKGNDEFRAQNFKLANDINATLPTAYTGQVKTYDNEGNEIAIKTVEDAYQYVSDFRKYMDKYPEVFRHTKRVEGLLGDFGTHAAGLLVSDIPIEYISPLRQSKKGLATQFSMDDVEAVGLIKFDLLALAALSTIKESVSLVKESYDIDLDIANIPLDDKNTLDLYKSGKLNGVFQFERGGMQQTAMDIGIDRFADVVACVALYRPGPMDNIPDFIERKKGLKKITYMHDKVRELTEPYLKETHGIICVHEDTEVAMADGTKKPIKKVHKGDKVISISNDSFLSETKKCLGCAATKYGNGLKITLENDNVVTVTHDHKIMTFDGMKKAEDLSFENDIVACPEYIIGDRTTTSDNCLAQYHYGDVGYYRVADIQEVDGVQFYDLSVEDNHNFIGDGIVLSNCYQEQLMQVCNSLANFDITDGYMMIKAVSKKKMHLMQQYKEMFVSGCVGNGVPEKVAHNYWDSIIVPFADYAFNKCIDGSMVVRDSYTEETYSIEDLYKKFHNNSENIFLNSYNGSEIVPDKVEDVFITGEKEVFEIELEDGSVIRSTLDHKFMCSDKIVRTVSEILEGDHAIMSYDKEHTHNKEHDIYEINQEF